MNEDMYSHIAHIATAIADTARAKMLCLLMDSRAYTATELSTAADIAPSTASSHLAKLTESGLIKRIKQGRYHYFCISNSDVSAALELLMNLSQDTKIQSIKSSTPDNLKCSRTCFKHMAGNIAVQLRDFLIEHKWLQGDESYNLTEKGKQHFQLLGMDISTINTVKMAYDCLDWSERKPHLAGDLANKLLVLLEQKEWLYRYPQSRQLFWTDKGKRNMNKHFSIIINEKPMDKNIY